MDRIMVLRIICIFVLILLAAQGNAQVVPGKVLDASNNQPLVGANLTDSTRSKGTVTDTFGRFNWDLGSNGSTIFVNHLGYQELKVKVENPDGSLRILVPAAAHQLPQIVVTASNTSGQLLEVPASVSLISKNEIERDNGTNIAEPLNRIPGLYMHSGSLNTNRVTIRGIGSRSLFSTSKIRAYLNDIPLTTGDGETTIEDIDLGLVERVEVLKGPASSIYGAGLGGTINMKTLKAPYHSTDLSSELTVGSYGLIRSVNTIEHGTDELNIKVNYNTIHQDSYRENNQYDRKTGSILSQFYLGDNSTLTVWGSWISLLAFIPSSLDSAAFAEDPRQAAFTWVQTRGFEDYNKGLVGANFQHLFSDQWELSASLFGSFRNSYELRPFNILEEDNTALGSRVRFSFRPKVESGKLTWVFGAEYFNEEYQWQTFENNNREQGSILSDNDERRWYYNLFTEVNWALTSGTIFTAGINYNNTRYNYHDLIITDGDQSGNYSFDAQWSPRVAVLHNFSDKFSVYGQLSHGFSPPTLAETLTPDGSINPDIQPETGFNLEFGTRGQLVKSKLSYDLSLYSMYIDNLLVARRTGDDQFVGVNAGKTRHRGIDVSLGYELLPEQSSSNLYGWLTYGYADYFFKEFVEGDNDFSGNELTGTPAHKLNWGTDYIHKSGLYGNINFLYVSSMPMRDDNSIYSDAYALLNLKLGYQKAVSKMVSFKVFAAVNNLWDESYASMISVNAGAFGGNAPRYYYPGLPRNYYGGGSVNIKLK
ncbi:MAG: TonB-dependent receptor [Cyclobacteriaceae bacterium]|nr:MAG: TonB-dependent receptor [Cyclobacteriaceae bacterium]